MSIIIAAGLGGIALGAGIVIASVTYLLAFKEWPWSLWK